MYGRLMQTFGVFVNGKWVINGIIYVINGINLHFSPFPRRRAAILREAPGAAGGLAPGLCLAAAPWPGAGRGETGESHGCSGRKWKKRWISWRKMDEIMNFLGILGKMEKNDRFSQSK